LKKSPKNREFFRCPKNRCLKVGNFSLLKKSQVYPKSHGTRPTRGDKNDFGFFFSSFDLFVVAEGRKRVCSLPQSLCRQLDNHFHHHQGFLSGARVQFHLPTGVE
jgi:hypothetical protein